MKYCVIGKTLLHTMSPEIHSLFGCKNYGVEELADETALSRFMADNCYDGFNVTIPYKQSVIKYLDGISDVAKGTGAVNTVVKRGGKYFGYNTDVDGMKFALDSAGISLKGKRALILGSGGAAHTAAYLTRQEGGEHFIVSRSGDINYSNCYDIPGVQVIINATPVGMMPNSYDKPVDLSRFAALEGVFDAIYNPFETLFIKEARALNLHADNGLKMLAEQARLARELFDGKKPKSSSLEVCKILEGAKKNIVFIGMSGCGKSTIGRRVARLLGRDFIDTDKEVEKKAGKTIPEIFADDGEEQFRRLESAAIENACSQFGKVISTGGGAALSDKNAFYIKANGYCVFLDRNIDSASLKGRPLTATLADAKALYEKRLPKYRALADITITNNGDINSAVNNTIGSLKHQNLYLR